MSTKSRKNKSNVPKKGTARLARIPSGPPNPPARPKVRISKPGYPSIAQSLDSSSLLVSAPTSQSMIQRSGVPNMQYRANGDCFISHREFIADIPGSVLFGNTSISINPGLSGSFPWLSRIASNFESYIFRRLCFAFATEASTAATGTVVLAVDYNPNDPAPTSKMQALSYSGSVRSSPWNPSCHYSLPENLHKRKTYFTRAGAAPGTGDLSLYDVGNLFVGTSGQATTTNVGELWVEYEITLMTPQSASASSGNSLWGKAVFSSGNLTSPTVTGNLPATYSYVGGTSPGTTSQVWTFTQPWQGVMSVGLTGTGITLGQTQSGTTGVGGTDQFQNNGAGTAGAGWLEASVLPGQYIYVDFVNTTFTGATIDFTQGLGSYN